MGVRLYDPILGRFLQTDPIKGGSVNDYDYCDGDPINCNDLAGTEADRAGAVPSEKRWCSIPSRWGLCALSLKASRLSFRFTLNRFGQRGGRGIEDAYQHFIWMALVAYSAGAETARGFGNRHENFKGNNAKDMALHNNRIGAMIGARAASRGISARDLGRYLESEFDRLWDAGKFWVQECHC